MRQWFIAMLVSSATAHAISGCASDAQDGPDPVDAGEPAPQTPAPSPSPADDTEDADHTEDAEDTPDAGEPDSAPIAKGTFEAASAACNGWQGQGADIIRSVPPHSGSFACRVCADGTEDGLALSRRLGPLEPGIYMFSGWVARRVDRPAPQTVEAVVVADAEGEPLEARTSVPLTRSYTFMSVSFALDHPAREVTVSFEASANEGACVLVDDAFIVRHREGG